MNEYQRDIVSFLRTHGANDVNLVPGGKHPKIAFTFRGKRIERAIAATPSDHRAAANMIAELRTLLGDPVVKGVVPKRTLDELIPSPPPSDAPLMGTVALYRDAVGSLRLRFFPPPDAAALLPAGVAAARLAPSVWRLRSDPTSRRMVRVDGNKHQLDVGSSAELSCDHREPFGVSPAEYRIVDGAVHVRLLTDRLRPVEKRAKRNSKVDPIATDRASSAPAPEPPTTAGGARWVEPPLTPRDVLVAIAAVEKTTSYRLVKLKDDAGWAWQAPLIKLGEC